VLRAVYEVSNTKSGDWPYVSQVNELLEREPFDDGTDRAIRDLGNAGYLAGAGNVDHLTGPIDCELTEKSLRVLAGWPSPEQSAEAS
jgi:hypothetical protein